MGRVAALFGQFLKERKLLVKLHHSSRIWEGFALAFLTPTPPQNSMLKLVSQTTWAKLQAYFKGLKLYATPTLRELYISPFWTIALWWKNEWGLFTLSSENYECAAMALHHKE